MTNEETSCGTIKNVKIRTQEQIKYYKDLAISKLKVK